MMTPTLSPHQVRNAFGLVYSVNNPNVRHNKIEIWRKIYIILCIVELSWVGVLRPVGI